MPAVEGGGSQYSGLDWFCLFPALLREVSSLPMRPRGGLEFSVRAHCPGRLLSRLSSQGPSARAPLAALACSTL